MHCPHCGQDNASNATQCIRCGQGIQPEVAPPPPVSHATPPAAPVSSPSSFSDTERTDPPSNHLIFAILSSIVVFLVCCLNCVAFPGIITGIIAIVYAAQVNSKLAAEDHAGAASASKMALILSWVTTAFIALGVLTFLGFLVFGGMGAYQDYLEQMRDRLYAMNNAAQLRWRWAGLALLLAACAALMLFHRADPNDADSLFPPCMFHALTGWYCVGCGATRALHALAHADLLTALHMNALLVFLLPLLAGTVIWNAGWQPQRLRAVADALARPWLWIWLLPVFGIVRNLPWPPFVWLAPGGLNG